MATSIPPHNLGDVIDATVRMIDDENCDIEDLIDIDIRLRTFRQERRFSAEMRREKLIVRGREKC